MCFYLKKMDLYTCWHYVLFSLPRTALVRGMLLVYVVKVVDLHSPLASAMLARARCCLRCRFYKLAFLLFSLPRQEVLISLAVERSASPYDWRGIC